MSPKTFTYVMGGVRLVGDLIIIPCVIILAYIVKFKINWVSITLFKINYGDIYHHAQIEPYIRVLPIIIIVWIISLYFCNLYKSSKGIMPEIDELSKTIKGVSLASIQIMAISFFYKSIPESRYVLFYAWGIGIITIYTCRLLLLKCELMMIKKGIGCHNTLIIGGDIIGQDIAEKITQFPTYQLNYCGTIDDTAPDSIHYHLRHKFTLLGPPSQYQSLCHKLSIDTIFLTKKDLSHTLLTDLVDFCENQYISLKVLGDSGILTPLSHPEVFDGLPIISTKNNISITNLMIKKVVDRSLGCLLLIGLSPVLILISLLIKSTSRGPIFYSQERIGQHNKVFKMIKFRSMIMNAEQHSGPTMVDETHEARYTPIGKWLRQWSLDELPQLINIIKGEMSLVGPRPERPHFAENFIKSIPFYNYRHNVPVGLTGWAQINGRSALTRHPDYKIKYDIYYIKNWSLLLDFKILLKTILVVLKREDVY